MNTEQSKRNQIIGGMRDLKAARHWRALEPGYSLRKKPKKILVLPGNGAETAKSANGMCKVAQDLVGNTGVEYEVCGFYYPDNDKSPQATIARAETLLHEYFVPLIADKNQIGELQRLSEADACQNMRNVVVMTHCYGSRVMAAIDAKLDEIMADIGYSETEIKNIHRQLFVAHHNNPRDDLGQCELYSSNLYRITQADERNRPIKYEQDSFPYYLTTEDLQADEVLLSAINDTEHALIIPKICHGEESEHNGAYWLDKNKKTHAGQMEEEIFRTIFKEAVTSTYHIESLEQLEERAIQKNPSLRSLFAQITEYGQEFAEEYREYAASSRDAFGQAKNKLLQGKLTAADIEQLSPEALFGIDAERNGLLDLAADRQDVIAVKNIWQCMRGYLPEPEIGQSVPYAYDNESANLLNAKIRQRVHLQRALDKDNVPMFLALSETADLPYLSYETAGDKLIYRIAKTYCTLTPEAAKTDLMQFRKSLDAISQRFDRLPPQADSAETKKALAEKTAASNRRYHQLLDMIRPQGRD